MTQAAWKTGGERLWGDFPTARDTVSKETAANPVQPLALVPETGVTAMLAQLLSSVRRNQKKHFPGSLGSDSCWAVLLQLYAAHVYQHRLHIQALTERTGVPATTVLRALEALVAAGFATRSDHRFDRRRVVVELTEAGARAMNACLVNSGPRAALA